MKNIITALANPELNEILKQQNEICVQYNDIQYQEGVIEILKENHKIDILILSEILPGKFEIQNFILEIKKYKNNLEIIIFLENKKQELEIFLNNQGIYNIYYNNQIDSEELIKQINKKEKNKEIDLIKNIIKKENKIITICGASGTGKSLFAINLAITIKDKKILIIDLDILNNCIHTILGIKRKNNNGKINLENLIINYNKNIDIISMFELIENQLIDKNNIKEFFNKIQFNYDYIIIDTSLECFWKENRKIMETSYANIFLVEANLLEIKKAKRILEIYDREWNIKKDKIKIVFNKYNINSINKKLLKKLFFEYKVLGKINFNLYYNLLINKNYKSKKELNKVKNEYINILNKI